LGHVAESRNYTEKEKGRGYARVRFEKEKGRGGRHTCFSTGQKALEGRTRTGKGTNDKKVAEHITSRKGEPTGGI